MTDKNQRQNSDFSPEQESRDSLGEAQAQPTEGQSSSKQGIALKFSNPPTEEELSRIPSSGPYPLERQRHLGDDEMTLDDARRVKVISPGALILRRFIRNRLAVFGVVLLVIMFLFSFVGGAISPYGQDQTFKRYETQYKVMGGARVNREYRYTSKEGVTFPKLAQAKFIQAKNANKATFESNKINYGLEEINDKTYLITSNQILAEAKMVGKFADIKVAEDLPDPSVVTDEILKAFGEAVEKNKDSFEIGEVTYSVSQKEGSRDMLLTTKKPATLASMNSMSVFERDLLKEHKIDPFYIQLAVEEAAGKGEKEIKVGEDTFRIDNSKKAETTVYFADKPVATIGSFVVQPISQEKAILYSFREDVIKAIEAGETSFTSKAYEGDEDQLFKLEQKEGRYDIKGPHETYVYDALSKPSRKHWLGTDKNGMDSLTRLMYGGRISLLVGFVVVIIAMVIGVSLGGISGFFGGWVDNLIMRLVDIMYCIPTWPILIIFGTVMDAQRAEPNQRMISIMVILGVLGWAGITRLVRGQILSLREQEFMEAAEATGLSTRRRIFRHLVPNVMPQLIVSATLSLGGTILTESTLSYLGLGVKYPYASWGNIVNSVSDQYVMMNHPQAWIPAGLCILITVIAFNFVGDGLRDAFDPKMKR